LTASRTWFRPAPCSLNRSSIVWPASGATARGPTWPTPAATQDGQAPPGQALRVRHEGRSEHALAELVDSVGKGTLAHDERQTPAHFLAQWLTEKERNGLRPTTLRGYRDHIEGLIVPLLGRERLRDSARRTSSSYYGKPPSRATDGTSDPASIRRRHATVRSALGTAKRRRLITLSRPACTPCGTVKRP